MRAIQVSTFGGSEVLKLCDKHIGKPGAREVLVRLKMAGLNFIDIYQRRGTYPLPLPYTPGMEGAGVVEAVGEEVKEFKPGDHVAYLHEPGTYAEQAIVPVNKLILLPSEMSFEMGAAFPLQGMTAHYLLHEYKKIKKGDTVLIHAAAGGMGLILVQWAKHLGATVLGTTSTREKAEMAKKVGADSVIIYTERDFATEVKKMTQGKGADLIIDGVGKTTFMGNLEAASVKGHIVIFGAASGAADPISANALMPKSLTVSGGTLFNYIAERQELVFRAQAVIEGILQGWLKLHIDKIFPLQEAALAHARLEKRESIGKILLSTEE